MSQSNTAISISKLWYTSDICYNCEPYLLRFVRNIELGKTTLGPKC